MSMYPPAQAFRFEAIGATVQLMTGAGVLVGWSITNESSSAAAALDIYDGPADNDHWIASVNLAANESTRDLWAPSGIELRAGLSVIGDATGAFGTIFAIPAEIVDAFLVTHGYRPLWGGE